MKSGDAKPENGKAHDIYFIVPGDVLNRVVMPLTVVHGHVQLLRRRVQRDQVIESEQLERVLTQMEDATRSIIAELSGIIKATSDSGRGSDAD